MRIGKRSSEPVRNVNRLSAERRVLVHPPRECRPNVFEDGFSRLCYESLRGSTVNRTGNVGERMT